MTREPTDIEKTPFQPITTASFPSAKVIDSLSSISVLRKPSPETTKYTITRVNINGRNFINDMCSSNPYLYLVHIDIDMYKACHLYLTPTGKYFFELLQVLKVIHMLHTFANKSLFFLC